MRENLIILLSELEEMELDYNSYVCESDYCSLINNVIVGRLHALSGYLRQLEMPDLLELVIDMDPESIDAVQTLETLRSYVLPEIHRRLDNPECTETVKNIIAVDDLIKEVDALRGLMISVATGGQKIQSVNDEYVERNRVITSGLSEHGIRNPNPFSDLWAWHGKWSSGDLPTYQSRRNFIRELYDPLTKKLEEGSFIRVVEESTGWERVDRGIDQIRRQLRSSETEEQFQAVGLYCRETFISVAKEVYDPNKHPPIDEVEPSSSDGKRMLESFIATELKGSVNKASRKFAKAALDLANELQHKRNACYRDAALCTEATISVVNIVALISGKRQSG